LHLPFPVLKITIKAFVLFARARAKLNKLFDISVFTVLGMYLFQEWSKDEIFIIFWIKYKEKFTKDITMS